MNRLLMLLLLTTIPATLVCGADKTESPKAQIPLAQIHDGRFPIVSNRPGWQRVNASETASGERDGWAL